MAETFMSRLREAIMPLHDEAEKSGPLHAIPDMTINLNNYVELLARVYGFVLPAEKLIGDTIGPEPVALDYKDRKRVPHLVKDLAFLGMPEHALEDVRLCTTIPHIDTVPRALGYLYLFEGSRLGGLVLAKALKVQFGFENNHGYSYFGSDGQDVAMLWKSFRSAVEDYVATGGDGPEIILAARTCFACLNKWLSEV